MRREESSNPELAVVLGTLVLGLTALVVWAFAQQTREEEPAPVPLLSVKRTAREIADAIAAEAESMAVLPALPGKAAAAPRHAVLEPPPSLAFAARHREERFGREIVFTVGPARAEQSVEEFLAKGYRIVRYSVEGGGGLVTRRVYPAFTSLDPPRYHPVLPLPGNRLDPARFQDPLEEGVVATAPAPLYTDIRLDLFYAADFSQSGKADLRVRIAEYPGGDRSQSPEIAETYRRLQIP